MPKKWKQFHKKHYLKRLYWFLFPSAKKKFIEKFQEELTDNIFVEPKIDKKFPYGIPYYFGEKDA